jgi:hypothetical protein
MWGADLGWQYFDPQGYVHQCQGVQTGTFVLPNPAPGARRIEHPHNDQDGDQQFLHVLSQMGFPRKVANV